MGVGDDAGYAGFERVLESALEAVLVRLLACCVMPDHAPLNELARLRSRTATTRPYGQRLNMK